MADRTMTAMYDTKGAAESARNDLVALGIPSANISIRGTESGTTTSSTTEDKGFLDSVADFFFPDEDQHTYAEGIRRGGFLLSARVPDGMEDQATDVLERYDPADMDERAESWRQSGWAGYQSTGTGAVGTAGLSEAGAGYAGTSRDYGTAGSGRSLGERASDAAGDTAEAVGLKSEDYDEQRRGSGTAGTVQGLGAASVRTGRDQDVVERAEEELRVGKREVGRGGVRVRSYVTERPVEEQVNLREERVQVERRPVDRPVQPGDAVFQEREISATERGEEAVIDKQARVVEEIGIRKDVDTRTETVRDTVRKQEVEVEDTRVGTDRVTGTRDRV